MKHPGIAGIKLPKAQETFLRKLGLGQEIARPNQAVVALLRRKGLLHTRPLHGKPGIWAQPTSGGHDLLRLIAAERKLHEARSAPPTPARVPVITSPARTPSKEDPLTTVRRLMQSTGFDEDDHEGSRLLFSSREEGDIAEGRADPELARFALKQAAAIETAVPGAHARVEVVDEWITISVTLPEEAGRASPPPVSTSAVPHVSTAPPVDVATAKGRRRLNPGDEVKYTNFTIGGSSQAVAIVTWDHGQRVEARTLSGERIRLERAQNGDLRRFQ